MAETLPTYDEWVLKAAEYQARAETAEALLAEAEKVLRFYADSDSYQQAVPTTGPFSIGSSLPIHDDLGDAARDFLDRLEARSSDG